MVVRLLALGFAAALALWVVLAWQAPGAADDPYQMAIARARAQATLTALARQTQEDAANAARWQTVAAAMLPIGGTLALTTVAGLLVMSGVALWERRRPVVVVEALGVPVDRRALHAGAYTALPYAILEHRTQVAIAAGPQVPHTWSPHQVYQNHQEGALPAVPDALSLPTVPGFDALLESGQIGAGRPLLLGYGADGQPLTGTWRDLYSSAVAGLSGSGKTTTLRFLAGQSALHGARFLLLDPHADAGDESLAGTLAPLALAFLAPPASDPPAMLALLDTARGVMQARLRGQQPAAWPLIVAVDEWTALMGRSDLADPLAALVEGIAQEGRKVAVFALISGQIFTAARSGGTALRDALASAYICRMKREQARLLIPADDARRAPALRPGQALLSRATGEVLDIAIPNTTAGHMLRVGALLATPLANNQATSAPFLANTVATAEAPSDQATTPDVSQEARTALALFRQHKSMARVVEMMHGITSDKGRLYQAKLTEVSALVAEAIDALDP